MTPQAILDAFSDAQWTMTLSSAPDSDVERAWHVSLVQCAAGSPEHLFLDNLINEAKKRGAHSIEFADWPKSDGETLTAAYRFIIGD